jgi:hypothetical protein
LIFEVDKGLISDIYECNDFTCNQLSPDRRYKVNIEENDYPF